MAGGGAEEWRRGRGRRVNRLRRQAQSGKGAEVPPPPPPLLPLRQPVALVLPRVPQIKWTDRAHGPSDGGGPDVAAATAAVGLGSAGQVAEAVPELIPTGDGPAGQPPPPKQQQQQSHEVGSAPLVPEPRGSSGVAGAAGAALRVP
ncbi:hypothetical protein PLESTF_000931500 [Pleodorina starrii]|nr:hypothetical protein PLESTF_000931500 [Pleodorina starrii]